MSQSLTYRVVKTGGIGKLIPCPCDDPIILEFKDGIRDAFFLRELEPSTQPITDSYSTRGSAPTNGVKGKPKGLERGTIDKMLEIYRFLEVQSEPVYRATIEKAVGFNCTRPLMCQPSQSKQVTLESLGIAERIPGERTWLTWRLTELGRTEGADIIRGL
ncbi:hypothetical protein J4G02_22400 [Candidatus Poribacteria bacterium]|nr:hypothetical protein [Candidatus Poribacteria bacterium]